MQIAQYTPTHRLKAYSLAWKCIDLIYPPRCIVCGKIGFRCCPQCWDNRKLYSTSVCEKCGKPIPVTNAGLCKQCKTNPPPIKKIRSLGEYTGVLQMFITEMKYERNIGLAELILPDLVNIFDQARYQIDVVIPVPLSRKRERERGYNQVALWGRLFALQINREFIPAALQRIRDTRSQVSLPSEQRWENVRGAFTANASLVRGKNVLVLDDVITTGATLYECTKAVLQKEARSVSALTIARSSIKNTKSKGGSYV